MQHLSGLQAHLRFPPNINILVRPDGQPVVLDYGIARLAGVAAGEERGLFSGTPAYAAPEQHLGQDLDFRSGQSANIYSLGVTLFEVLTGRRLFALPPGAGVAAIRQAVLQGEPTRLSEVVPDCSRTVEEIVLRAIRRNPADRYHSVAALGRSLLRAVGEVGPAPVPAWTPAPGRTIPGTEWHLQEKIGEGSAGEVWTGMHAGHGEWQVFKFCNTEEKARTLRREFTLYRLLTERIGRYPHFIPLREISLDEPPWYVMMDHVAGLDLLTWCTARPGGIAAIPIETRLEIVAQAAEALQVAHDAGILHRDIKPANLLIGEADRTAAHAIVPEAVHVWIADFGIGKNLQPESEGPAVRKSRNTLSDFSQNQPLGTLLYLAPEVQAGQPATAKSDLYSLGVVFWQLLVGDLSIALDPTDWHARVADPLLRTDLAGCIAGVPEKRWSGAGEMAARVRSLPARRAEEAKKGKAQAALEKAAYRRGLTRASAFAAMVVALFAGLAWLAWSARGTARRAEGRSYVGQAAALMKTDLGGGRRNKGFRWLELAAQRDPDPFEFRNAAAVVASLADLIPAAAVPLPAPPVAVRVIPPLADETNRILSSDGNLLAIARNLDGLNGAVEIMSLTNAWRVVVERKEFPWVPIAEAGLFAFSPDHRLLAIGGAATSRQVLICDTASGSVRSYIFHGSDPTACAWYPGGNILATGCEDAGIRIWDLNAAKIPVAGASGSNTDFTLPPRLDVPALDVPTFRLLGHRAGIRYLAFSADGRWLASLDAVGTLQIRTGFGQFGTTGGTRSDFDATGADRNMPIVSVSVTVSRLDEVTGLAVVGQQVIAIRRRGLNEAFTFIEPSLPVELAIGPPVVGLAWNSKGDQLGFTSLNNLYLLDTSSQEEFELVPGVNPVGVGWAGGNCLYTSGANLVVHPPSREHNPRRQSPLLFSLLSAAEKQGAQTGLSATAGGRVAAPALAAAQARQDTLIGLRTQVEAVETLIPQLGGNSAIRTGGSNRPIRGSNLNPQRPLHRAEILLSGGRAKETSAPLA